MTTPNYHSVRDEAGKFAPASSPNGGGTPNFGGEGFQYPTTRDALLQHATSRPSTAPTITGSDFEAPEPFDAKAALSEVTPDPAEPPATNSWGRLREADQGQGEPEPDFSTALRAGGYGPSEHAGMARPDLSQHLTSEVPPPVPNIVGHPAPRINFGSFGSSTPNGGGEDFGGENEFGGGNGGI